MKISKSLTIYLVAFSVAIFSFAAAPVYSQVITKTTTSIPPGQDIFPGDTIDVTIRVPGGTEVIRNAADTMLVMDTTGSMGWNWGTPPVMKLRSAKDALKAFVDETKEDKGLGGSGDYVGLATYNTCLDTGADGVDKAHLNVTIRNMTGPNKTILKNQIEALTDCGATSVGAGIDVANKELLNLIFPPSSTRDDVPKYIVLATDGLQNTAPSPYENGILQTAINNKIVIFTVGIGDDVRGPGAISSGCVGCPDIPNVAGSQTSGEMIMKDIACQTDPDCSYTWNTGNSPDVNDLDNPAHYYYAPDGDDLEDVYQDIANEIAGDYTYQIVDILNRMVFEGSIQNFTVKDCDPPYDDWPLGNQIIGPQIFMIRLEAIPAGKTVCINFQIKTYDSDDMIRDSEDCDGDGDIHEQIRFGECVGNGNWFPTDDMGIAVVWNEEAGNCDEDGDGWLDILELMKCWNVMQTMPLIEIPLGLFFIINPVDPWLQTTGGDVGAWAQILMNRGAGDPPIPGHNADYLVLANGAITAFSSARNWLVPSYLVDIDPTPNPTMYEALWNKYTRRCDPIDENIVNRNNVRDNVHSGCNLVRHWDSGPADLTISGGTWKAGPGYDGYQAVVFVDGNLTIEEDIVVAPERGLIFIVSGNISIDPDVTRMDGIFITNGSFNTYTDDIGNVPPCNSLNTSEQLVINGAVYVFGQPCFTRSLPAGEDRDTAAEQINFEPKHLWLFQEPIGDSKVIYRESAP